MSIKFKIQLNRTDWQIVITFYVIYAIVSYAPFNTFKGIVIDFLVNFLISMISIIILIYWSIPKFIIQKKQLLFFSLITIFILWLGGNIDYIFEHISKGNKLRDLNISFSMIIYNIYRLSESTGFLLGILLTKKVYEMISVIHEIEKAKKESELKVLRGQLNPHFLFNNLNSLNTLIDTAPEVAKKYTTKLSKIYRYLIQTKDDDIIELNKELQFAQNYIYLIKIRFLDNYNFIFEKDYNNLNNKFIPIGALQTLLENVIKHNKTTLKQSIDIHIIFDENYLTVTNTKTELTNNQKTTGTGIENISKRYLNYTNKKIEVKNTDKYYQISIPIIPINKQ